MGIDGIGIDGMGIDGMEIDGVSIVFARRGGERVVSVRLGTATSPASLRPSGEYQPRPPVDDS